MSKSITVKVEPFVVSNKAMYSYEDKQLANFDKLAIFDFLKEKYPQLINPIVETIVNSKKIIKEPKPMEQIIEELCKEYGEDLLEVCKNLEKDEKGNLLDEQEFCDDLNSYVREYMDKNYIKYKVDNDDQFDTPCRRNKHDSGRNSPEEDNSYIVWKLNIKAPEDSSTYLKNLETIICDSCKEYDDNEVYDSFHEEIFQRVTERLNIKF